MRNCGSNPSPILFPEYGGEGKELLPDAYLNKFGRKPGRGVRPWLLIPKIFGLITYVGGFCAVLVLWIASDFTSLELTDPRREMVLHQVSRILVFLIVPAALTTILFGVLLLLQHPRVFLSRRWMQVKLLAILTVIPTCHFYARSQYTQLKNATEKNISDSAAGRFQTSIIAAIAGSAVVIVLGRLKPRLGQ
jgi:uncharacterized membrane protein